MNEFERFERLTQKEKDQYIIGQANQVLQTMATPGWKIIELAIHMTKRRIEQDGLNSMRTQTGREKSMFCWGEMSGVDRVRESFYDLIKQGKVVERKIQYQKETET